MIFAWRSLSILFMSSPSPLKVANKSLMVSTYIP